MATTPTSRSRQRREVTRRVVVSVLAWAVGLLFLVPLAWMLISSFKPDLDILALPISWLPRPATLVNYQQVLNGSFARFTVNSVIVAVLRVGGDLITATLAGYAFSRLQWRGRGLLFALYLGVMAIPYQLLLIPRFVLFRETHLYNTLWALILPGAFTAFGAFVMRQYFMTIPQEYLDAARIDGASHLQLLRRVIAPLAAPALTSLAMVDFIWSWNDYETPLIMITSLSHYTLPLGLTTFMDVNGGLSPGPALAASVVSLVPVMILFLALRRQFQKALLGTGLKG